MFVQVCSVDVFLLIFVKKLFSFFRNNLKIKYLMKKKKQNTKCLPHRPSRPMTTADNKGRPKKLPTQNK